MFTSAYLPIDQVQVYNYSSLVYSDSLLQINQFNLLQKNHSYPQIVTANLLGG